MKQIISRREREKQFRKSEIIDTAEKLFYEKGFDGTSMDEVAKEAQFSKRTIYQYFINKEDLFSAIMLKAAKQLESDFEEAFKKGVNALEKIRLANITYYRYYKNNPEFFNLMIYTPISKPNKEISPNFQEILKIRSMSFEKFTQLIDEGKKDGSIRPDLDTKKAAHFIIITSFSFLNNMSDMGKEYWDYYGFEKEDFILFGYDLLTDTLAKK